MKLGKSWDELLQPASAASLVPDLNTTATHDIEWGAVFDFIRELNPPSGKWAAFLSSLEGQFERKGCLTPKQRRAVLSFYRTAVANMHEFEEEE